MKLWNEDRMQRGLRIVRELNNYRSARRFMGLKHHGVRKKVQVSEGLNPNIRVELPTADLISLLDVEIGRLEDVCKTEGIEI